jgi:hypothetical protein
MKTYSSREAVADILERFLKSNLNAWEWDDFVGVPQRDPELEDIRKTCLRVRQEYPAGAMGAWCSAAGIEEIRKAAARLRTTPEG